MSFEYDYQKDSFTKLNSYIRQNGPSPTCRTFEHVPTTSEQLENRLRAQYCFHSIIGHHPSIIEILKVVSQVANTAATVLICGESGTGKELIARSLHDNSSRKNQPFVPINCGALPENLLESELFGHVRGAFTGAIKDSPGWLERAHRGTIFLDEVCEMTPAMQVKLLRVLQTGDYSPVGSARNRKCDVRFISASNQELQTLVEQTRFRKDLFYRLNVIDIKVPGLRERLTDIPLLFEHFCHLYCSKYKIKILKISPAAEELLLSYDFPGNVRELQNIVQRCAALAESEIIMPQHLPSHIYNQTIGATSGQTFSSFKIAKRQVLEQFEQKYIKNCLMVTRGNISRAASVAGINVKNFYIKMKHYGIDANVYKSTME